MADSSLLKNNFITIKIEDANTNLYNLVYCLVRRPLGDTVINADGKGIIVVENSVDSIHLKRTLLRENSFLPYQG